ncbi:MAG: peptidase dimerization domain-containing protein [Acidimicrobiia bacterium]|nr:peptidase dimerization domain-containing protein [Acidimicrobiia bacterium]
MTTATDAAALKGRVAGAIADARATVVELSHDLHAHPELAMQERHAHDLLADTLEQAGFAVTRHAHDVETAFRAEIGTGAGPQVVVCAEYDALPGIGHACGHNLIGASSVGAGLSLAGLVDDLGVGLCVLGTPAEEAVGGKAILVERGAFSRADVALMVHPAPLDIREAPALAVNDLVVTVHGKAAHASLSRSRRANALEGLVEVYRLLSAHPLGDWERCHGVITHGGDAPNVVPERTEGHWLVRARTDVDAATLAAMLRDEIETTLADSGCTVEFTSAMEVYREMKHNHVLAGAYQANAEALGREFVPQALIGPESASSTDMGNVSQVVPSIHPMIGIDSLPALNHQRGFADAAVSAAADTAVHDAAYAIAATVVDLAVDSDLMAAVRADFERTDSVGDPLER